MSLRTEYIENEEVEVILKLKVKLNSFTNHNGVSDSMKKNSLKEFRETIKDELLSKIEDEHQMSEFLTSTDFVSYNVFEYVDDND